MTVSDRQCWSLSANGLDQRASERCGHEVGDFGRQLKVGDHDGTNIAGSGKNSKMRHFGRLTKKLDGVDFDETSGEFVVAQSQLQTMLLTSENL